MAAFSLSLWMARGKWCSSEVPVVGAGVLRWGRQNACCQLHNAFQPARTRAANCTTPSSAPERVLPTAQRLPARQNASCQLHNVFQRARTRAANCTTSSSAPERHYTVGPPSSGGSSSIGSTVRPGRRRDGLTFRAISLSPAIEKVAESTRAPVVNVSSLSLTVVCLA